MTPRITLPMPSAGAKAAGQRPEDELLLCCARTSIDAARAARIKALLGQGIDWDYLIRTALRHGLMPLLYRNLKNTCPEAVPQARLDQLRAHFRYNILRSMSLSGELLKLLRLLEEHSIPAIPYKGPVLAVSVYGDVALRRFGDLDILVHKRDVLRAKDLLISLGYRPELCMNPAQEAAYLRSQCEYDFIHATSNFLVEIHWKILPSYCFPLDSERLWEHLETVSLLGVEVPSLSAENLLLVLCAHGSKHRWERLELICAVAELLRVHQAMDWEQVIELADSSRSRRTLLIGLLLAHDLLDAALPEKVLQSGQADPTAVSLAAQVRGRLFRDDSSAPGPLERFQFFRIRTRERLWDRLWYGLHQVTTPGAREWKLLALPSALYFLYYPLRPIRLAGEVLGLLKTLFRWASARRYVTVSERQRSVGLQADEPATSTIGTDVGSGDVRFK
jgi:hypothetical protein